MKCCNTETKFAKHSKRQQIKKQPWPEMRMYSTIPNKVTSTIEINNTIWQTKKVDCHQN